MVLEQQQQQPQQVKRIGFVRSLVTQSTFEGRLWRETWYGFHHVWKRIVFCQLVAFTIASSINTLHTLSLQRNIPILKFGLSDAELQSIRDSHSACAEALCEASRKISFECVLDYETGRAHVETAHDDEDMTIRFPPECKVAFEKTFGIFLWEDEVGEEEILFQSTPSPRLEISSSSSSSIESEGSPKIRKRGAGGGLFELKTNKCAISINEDLVIQKVVGEQEEESQSYLPARVRNGGDYVPDIKLFDRSIHNQRQEFLGERLFCPDRMPPELVRTFQSCYEWWLNHRVLLYLAVVVLSSWMLNFLYMMGLFYALVFRALFLGYALWWPTRTLQSCSSNTNGAGRRQRPAALRKVTVWSIFKTLVLINILTQRREGGLGDLLLVGCLSASALLLYKDTRAAIEWAFLASLWLFADSATTVLDGVLPNMISKFDKLNLVPLAASLIGWLLVPAVPMGQGVSSSSWWKLVTLYAYYRAYPMKHKYLRRFPLLSSSDDNDGDDDRHATTHVKVD